MGSLRDRKVACSTSDYQGPNFELCVWRAVSSHYPQEGLLAQFSLYVHKGGLIPHSFQIISCKRNSQLEVSGNCVELLLTRIWLAQPPQPRTPWKHVRRCPLHFSVGCVQFSTVFSPSHFPSPTHPFSKTLMIPLL